MDDSHFRLLYIIVPITSLAGLANLLRNGKPMPPRAILSVILNSGLFGLTIASYLLHKLGPEAFGLILSVSVLSGLGGNAVVDFAVEAGKSMVRSYIAGIGKKDGDDDKAE